MTKVPNCSPVAATQIFKIPEQESSGAKLFHLAVDSATCLMLVDLFDASVDSVMETVPI